MSNLTVVEIEFLNCGPTYSRHGTKQRTDNQLHSLELPVVYAIWELKFDIEESDGNIFNSIF